MRTKLDTLRRKLNLMAVAFSNIGVTKLPF